MGASLWHSVLAINDRGLMLGIAADGSWVVGDDFSSAHPAAESLMAMLPLLAQSYRQVEAVVAAQVPPHRPGPPWPQLLELALGWPSEYWPGLALGWLEDGYPVAGLLDVLAGVKDAPGRSQPLRHRALRLWRSARG
jgi:hypothetical protein